MDAAQVTLHHGDCLDVLRTLPAASVDAVVTDPPYGLEFMGKDWDRPWAVGISQTGYTDGVERLARPAFGDSRNANCRTCKGRQRGEKRCSCATPDWDRHPREDMRAFQQWCEAWAAECLRILKPGGHLAAFGGTRTYHRLASGIEDAGFQVRDSLHWMHGQGFPKGKGQLKPAHEPIVLARKPAPAPWLNVDACRVMHGDDLSRYDRSATSGYKRGGVYGDGEPVLTPANASGRWPANVLLSHGACDDSSCEPGCPVAELDRQSGITKDGTAVNRNRKPGTKTSWYGTRASQTGEDATYGGQGGASRFFPVFRYQAKAPAAERPKVDGVAHSTVKPLALMRWLVRLLTPPGGTILEPFAGSGTTIEAAILEGFAVIGIEREADYLPLIEHRIDRARATLNAAGVEPDDPGLFDVPA